MRNQGSITSQDLLIRLAPLHGQVIAKFQAAVVHELTYAMELVSPVNTGPISPDHMYLLPPSQYITITEAIKKSGLSEKELLDLVGAKVIEAILSEGNCLLLRESLDRYIR